MYLMCEGKNCCLSRGEVNGIFLNIIEVNDHGIKVLGRISDLGGFGQGDVTCCIEIKFGGEATVMIKCCVEMGKSGSALGAQETSLDGDNIFRHIGVRIALRIVIRECEVVAGVR